MFSLIFFRFHIHIYLRFWTKCHFTEYPTKDLIIAISPEKLNIIKFCLFLKPTGIDNTSFLNIFFVSLKILYYSIQLNSS